MRQQIFEDALKAIVARLARESTSFGAGVDKNVERLSDAVLDVRLIAATALDRKSDPAGMSTTERKNG